MKHAREIRHPPNHLFFRTGRPDTVKDVVGGAIPVTEQRTVVRMPELVDPTQRTAEHLPDERVEVARAQALFHLWLLERLEMHVDADIGELLLHEQREPFEPGVLEDEAVERETRGHAAVVLDSRGESCRLEP